MLAANNSGPAAPSVFVIFGATGDLSRRKLLPALGHLEEAGHLASALKILAVGRRAMPESAFREVAFEALAAAGIPPQIALRTIERIHYQATSDGGFEALKKRLEQLCRDGGFEQNYTFYLSLPPRAFEPTVGSLAEVGLNHSQGWTRLVVEKPFGRDLESARALNASIHRWFSEDQIYRIDHYLGKETVQNLLVFRFSNAFLEGSWNRDRVESVQITVGEQLGVGSRAGYYDHAGALRDMVQNHLTQLLTLVAMGAPSSFSATEIRNEKIKVLRSLRAISNHDIVRGQYVGGEIGGKPVQGYLRENGVAPGSTTETFVALRLFVDSWRWQGVPFYLRTGKYMPHKTTQIAIRFRGAPISFFEQHGCTLDTHDVLTITLQPHEGFAFYLDIKRPGSQLELERIPLRFDYAGHFDDRIPDAYQTLLLDVLQGDQTLFVHADEVEESWRTYSRVLDQPPPVYPYPAGSWGPSEADEFAIPEKDLWQRSNI